MNTDEMRELYETDPKGFEIRTNKMIHDLIESLPTERKLKARRVQWNVEISLRNVTDPIERMNIVLEKLWSSVYNLHSIMTDPFEYTRQHKAEEKLKQLRSNPK